MLLYLSVVLLNEKIPSLSQIMHLWVQTVCELVFGSFTFYLYRYHHLHPVFPGGVFIIALISYLSIHCLLSNPLIMAS